ncbi:MAG: response regulator transcription factor [Nitrospira sp.]|nr:response regulator transcription factor [Nitrospira sp.]
MMLLPPSTTTKANTILIVSQSGLFAQSLKKVFDANGYQSTTASTISAAVSATKEPGTALIIIDRRLKDAQAIRQLRQVTSIPIVAVQDAVNPCVDEECLQDYEQHVDLVVCSKSQRELLARVRAILRRSSQQQRGAHVRYQVGPIVMDVDRHEVTIGGRMVELTPKEFQILRQFLEAPNCLFSRQEMLNRVWGEGYALEEHALDVHIHALRRKIEQDPACPKMIITVRGVGYKLRG